MRLIYLEFDLVAVEILLVDFVAMIVAAGIVDFVTTVDAAASLVVERFFDLSQTCPTNHPD